MCVSVCVHACMCLKEILRSHKVGGVTCQVQGSFSAQAIFGSW